MLYQNTQHQRDYTQALSGIPRVLPSKNPLGDILKTKLSPEENPPSNVSYIDAWKNELNGRIQEYNRVISGLERKVLGVLDNKEKWNEISSFFDLINLIKNSEKLGKAYYTQGCNYRNLKNVLQKDKDSEEEKWAIDYYKKSRYVLVKLEEYILNVVHISSIITHKDREYLKDIVIPKIHKILEAIDQQLGIDNKGEFKKSRNFNKSKKV